MTDDYFDWDDRPVLERVTARMLLEYAGFQINGFASRDDDPPDCEGILNGKRAAIEVTRLNHEKARALNMKARKEKKLEHEVFFSWERDDLLLKIQKLIDKKDRDVKRYSGCPYERYVLVMHTDEFVLTSDVVSEWLKHTTFKGRFLTDVIVGLSHEPKIGGYPTFRLSLSPPCIAP